MGLVKRLPLKGSRFLYIEESSLHDRFPWARAELSRALGSRGFRRLRFPTGVGHSISRYIYKN